MFYTFSLIPKRENGFTMTMRSVMKIAKGQELVHAYSQPLDPVMTRRSLLYLGKFFQVIFICLVLAKGNIILSKGGE